jgi:hypothetical protein
VFFRQQCNLLFLPSSSCCIGLKALVHYRMFKILRIYCCFNAYQFKIGLFCAFKNMKHFVSDGVTGTIVAVIRWTLVICHILVHQLLYHIS